MGRLSSAKPPALPRLAESGGLIGSAEEGDSPFRVMQHDSTFPPRELERRLKVPVHPCLFLVPREVARALKTLQCRRIRRDRFALKADPDRVRSTRDPHSHQGVAANA